jgi:flagellar biosynthetic protein FlhB
MMPGFSMDDSRTEPATPRKLARAREQGQTPRSPDLIVAGGLLALAGSLLAFGGLLFAALVALLRHALLLAAEPGGPALALVASRLWETAVLVSVPLCAIAIGAALAGFVQVGPSFVAAAFAPDAQRIDPVERLRGMFAPERWLEVAWTLLKFLALLAVGAGVLWSGLSGLVATQVGSVPHAVAVLCALLLALMLRTSLMALLLGAVDLVYRHLRHRQQQRMSRHELAQERRETYGVPEHRERRQRLKHEALLAASLADLQQARVLLLDGTGRALALAFDDTDEKQHAPRVVAKAHGPATQRLWAKAEQSGIEVRLHPALVAALFRLELTEVIPPAHYAAVADVIRDLSAAPTSPR